MLHKRVGRHRAQVRAERVGPRRGRRDGCERLSPIYPRTRDPDEVAGRFAGVTSLPQPLRSARGAVAERSDAELLWRADGRLATSRPRDMTARSPALGEVKELERFA